MNDSYGDGWDTVLGFRQNETIVGTFGIGFSTGKSYGPVSVTIPGDKHTQIVVTKIGSWTEEIGFVIQAPNGTTIYTRTSGTRFTPRAVFLDFCPAGGCPATKNITYYLTVADSYGDGWSDNVLAFRQNGKYQTFRLSNGYSAGPFAYSFVKNVNVDIIVYRLGDYTR
jgi:hypothetical protein